ncbi:unnamed protein product [Durusdinium trenchii]|uniref:Uncharacterized protein n=1 Tax=Durusdinium trenchii TaxID=1381693 RepID=A0ABP0IM30_9DINO
MDGNVTFIDLLWQDLQVQQATIINYPTSEFRKALSKMHHRRETSLLFLSSPPSLKPSGGTTEMLTEMPLPGGLEPIRGLHYPVSARGLRGLGLEDAEPGARRAGPGMWRRYGRRRLKASEALFRKEGACHQTAAIAASVWIDAMASSGAFEMRVPTAKLKRSSCPVVPHTFQSALTEDDFGLSFKSRLHPTQSMDEVQAQIDYMWVQRLEFPVLEPWRSTVLVGFVLKETELAEQTTWAILPGITFAQGENEQHIRLDFFDGQRLAWTVDHLQLLGLRGESSGSEKASWEVRKPFRG